MVDEMKIVPPLIHTAYYRYPTLKQDLKLTPTGSAVNPSAHRLSIRAFINNPAYEQTAQDLYEPGRGRKTYAKGIDG
jgi:hypothetical protein